MSYDFANPVDTRDLGARYALKGRTTTDLKVTLAAHHASEEATIAAFDSYFFHVEHLDEFV